MKDVKIPQSEDVNKLAQQSKEGLVEIYIQDSQKIHKGAPLL